MLNAKLMVVGGEVKTTEIKLRLPCVIGRGKGSTVTLPHPLVSRQHCELFESNGRLWVRDLGSLNGTYVNNEKVTETELPPNELLTVGTVTFRAVYDPAVSNDATDPDASPLIRTAKAEEGSTPTIRVDSAPPAATEDDFELSDGVDLGNDVDLADIDDFDASEASGALPSAPLFASDVPPASAAPKSPPPRPIIPMAVAPPLSASANPPPADEGSEEIADPADDDDDLNDFLKGLGK
jgi:predicted component of type VI protein secretion system